MRSEWIAMQTEAGEASGAGEQARESRHQNRKVAVAPSVRG